MSDVNTLLVLRCFSF